MSTASVILAGAQCTNLASSIRGSPSFLLFLLYRIKSFRWPHSVILEKEGPNDGLVSVESSKWVGFPFLLACCTCNPDSLREHTSERYPK